MRFSKTLESQLTFEWREQYLNYVELKNIILDAVHHAPKDESITQYYHNFELEFFAVCERELARVERFYAQKLAEARRKFSELELQLRATQQRKLQASILRQLGLACSEFYLSMIMLQNYQSLNYTAFRKILKKYDKQLKATKGGLWFAQHVVGASFANDKELRGMIVKMEQLYTQYLTNGDRTKAMNKLRVPPLVRKTPSGTIFTAGLITGLFIVSSTMVILSYAFRYSPDSPIVYFFRLFRATVFLVLFLFLFALSSEIWQRSGINHVLIFDIDPRNHSPPALFLVVASTLGLICSMCMLGFLHHMEFAIKEPYHFPSLAIVVPILLLINPLCIMKFKARMLILKKFGRIFAAPFFHVNFSDFWIAEQFISLVQIGVDFYQLVRFYILYYRDHDISYTFEPDVVVTVIRCLPPWFRIAQSLRRFRDTRWRTPDYMINALKYFSMIIVVICSHMQMDSMSQYEKLFDNGWTWAYVITFCFSATYSLVWDCYMDFGLFKIWRGKNIFLRENLVYPKTTYYAIIVFNILIRYVWMLELSLIYYNVLRAFYSKSICFILEIIRRFTWNLLRLENEHLHNCGEFRAVRDIFLMPVNLQTDYHSEDEDDTKKSKIKRK
ncbi:xenotropic and polytropic retrovirus receptor 1 homolog [Drosophila busckii]|uniref:xenotropic and polytropic retrovirus receptor 1 homolog n=1 Tax=Drosophila busckii TaxID=30019 RepID=UPI001432D76F|nr:xenotropic and polytropic retrovirus receptor 1 homolog [Drosophila busckii]